MSVRNRTKKNRFAKSNEGKQLMTVSEYIERMEFRKNRTWTLNDNKWYVDCEGVLLAEKDFNRLFPAPVVFSFNHDITGIDSRKSYLHK